MPTVMRSLSEEEKRLIEAVRKAREYNIKAAKNRIPSGSSPYWCYLCQAQIEQGTA